MRSFWTLAAIAAVLFSCNQKKSSDAQTPAPQGVQTQQPMGSNASTAATITITSLSAVNGVLQGTVTTPINWVITASSTNPADELAVRVAGALPTGAQTSVAPGTLTITWAPIQSVSGTIAVVARDMTQCRTKNVTNTAICDQFTVPQTGDANQSFTYQVTGGTVSSIPSQSTNSAWAFLLGCAPTVLSTLSGSPTIASLFSNPALLQTVISSCAANGLMGMLQNGVQNQNSIPMQPVVTPTPIH